jgi:hypothetical protein
MITGRRILTVLLVVLLVGCSSKNQEVKRIVESPITVDADVDPSTDFSRYRTWRWIPVTQIPGQDPWGTGSPELSKVILDAFEGQLYSRGYEKVATSSDLIANFYYAAEDVDQAFLEEHFKGQFPEYKVDLKGKDTKNVSWKQGTLIFFLFDSKSGQMVWQASAQAEVTSESTMEQRQTRVNKVAKMMMEKLPKHG